MIDFGGDSYVVMIKIYTSISNAYCNGEKLIKTSIKILQYNR